MKYGTKQRGMIRKMHLLRAECHVWQDQSQNHNKSNPKNFCIKLQKANSLSKMLTLIFQIVLQLHNTTKMKSFFDIFLRYKTSTHPILHLNRSTYIHIGTT